MIITIKITSNNSLTTTIKEVCLIFKSFVLDVEINEEIKEMQQELLEKLEKIHKKGEKTSQMMGNLDT